MVKHKELNTIQKSDSAQQLISIMKERQSVVKTEGARQVERDVRSEIRKE